MEDDDSREGISQLGSEFGDQKKHIGTIKVSFFYISFTYLISLVEPLMYKF